MFKHTLQTIRRRLDKHDDDLRSLSIVSQVIRSNLTFDALLNIIYVQVESLLPVDHFTTALFSRDRKTLDFPVCIQHRERVDCPAETLIETSAPRHLIHHILTTGQPLLIERAVAAEAARLGFHAAPDAQSWIGVPLQAGGQIIGALMVASVQPGRLYTGNDLRLMNIVAASAGIALENAQLYEQQEARVRQLAALNGILTQLSGTLSPEAVLNTVIESVAIIAPEIRASAVYLFWDDGKTTLALTRSRGLSDHFVTDPPDPLVAQTESGRDFGVQPPILVEDVRESSVNADPLRATLQREGITAWIELPLRVGTETLGVLILYYAHPTIFPADQIEVLRTFATQVAQAISNARLYAITDEALERRVGQLLALAEIGHELTSTLDLKQISSIVLKHALDATHTRYGTLILQSAEGGEIEHLAARGYPAEVTADWGRVAQHIPADVLEASQPRIVNNVGAGTITPLQRTAQAILSVPIMRGEVRVGAITLESETAHAFNSDDMQFITQLANQAVIALDNARLFRRIAEALNRLQVILNAMQEALVLIDQQGVVMLANPRVQMLGIDPDELTGAHVETLLGRRDLGIAAKFGFPDAASLRRLVDGLRVDGAWANIDATSINPASFTLSHTDGSGAKRIQRQVIPVRGDDHVRYGDSNGRPIGALLVFYDETEQYQLAQTRDDLSRMLIHDLRSPLTAVTTSLKLMTEIVPKSAPYYSAVESTTDAARRAIRKLLTRVDSLLDVSRMESGFITIEAKPTELATLVDNVCVELSPLARELEVEVITDGVDQVPLLAIDADKVERVLLNLLDNALKFSPMGSRVIIRAALVSGASPVFVRVEMVDHGPGIPDTYKVTLFDRYVQVKGRTGSRRGSGLGLTFCRLVTEAHGGRIWIEDSPGGGSVFALTLPVAHVSKP